MSATLIIHVAGLADMNAILARIEAMKAGNAVCVANGRAPCYDDRDFIECADELTALAERLRLEAAQ